MRVLVVEDQPGIAEAIAVHLRRLGVVEVAPDGRTADACVADQPWDVIVLDRALPDGEGLRRLEAWRRRGVRAAVLVLTAADAVADRVAGLEAGADDYLVKPFALEELAARVRALARRNEQPVAPVLRIGPVELDLARGEVRRDGVVYPLKPKEYAVLSCLGRRAGRVLSQEQLLALCWEEEGAGSNVVEVAVAAVRRKLAWPEVIRTVRGLGYRVDVDG